MHSPLAHFDQQIDAREHAAKLDRLADEIEHARHVTSRARRGRHARLMRAARHIGHQLDAARRQLTTLYDRPLLDAATALLVVSRGYLDAITEQLDAIEIERTATTIERVHAVAVISQRRQLAEPPLLTR